jgi:putative MATE family efflux protein
MFPLEPSARVRAILSGTGSAAPGVPDKALERDVLRRVLAMGLPSVASFLLLTVYDLIDIFWLARLGEEPVAAVTVFGAALWILAFGNQIVGTGSVAVISRRFGAADAAGTERAIKATFLGKLAVGTAGGLVGIAVLPWALDTLGAAPAVRDLGVTYGRISCAGLGVSLASFSVYTALRSLGRPALGMWISLAGTVVNLVLDPLLIFGIGPFPRMGIAGAAVASLAGFSTVTGVGMAALAGAGSPVRVAWLRAPFPRLDETIRMIRIGIPSGWSSLSFALSASVVVKLVAHYGTTVVALFGMSNKVLMVGINVLSGLGLGTSALVGQFLGSREPHKAWLAAVQNLRLATGAMIACALFVAVAAPWIVRLFFPDEAMVEPGALYLRLLAAGLPFTAIILSAEQAYSGAGRTVPPMLLDLAVSWAMVVPLMVVLGLAMGLGPPGMMAGRSLAQALGAVIAVAMVRRGTWLRHEV